MDWERVGKIGYQFALTVIEWGFKLCAFVAGWLALGASGSFGQKLWVGFGSLSDCLRQLFAFPATFNEISWVAREYHQIGGAEFQEIYGLTPIDQFVNTLSGVFIFFHQVSINLSEAPFLTIIAGFLVFSTFYLLSRIIRFARQKGRGSWLCRFEQRLGDRVFGRGSSAIANRAKNASKPRSVDRPMKKSSPKLT